MQFQYFSGDQIIFFLIGAILLISSVFSFTFGKLRTSLLLLVLGSIGIGFFIASLDPFLNIWDEQYHALVAKNLSVNPFKPALYSNPLLEYDYRDWTGNHIWLHKQPLFLWQIALSIKLLGPTTLAVRLPCILLHALMAVLIFRIGKISISDRVGFYGALFFSVAYFPLELISGHFATDHNDFSFLFYITGSFWAWFEYQNSQKKHYLILIGLFSGCAILVKWLVGLLIYGVWILTIGKTNKSDWKNIKSYYPFLTSLTITIITFLPWQLYILSSFPLESKYEFAYNSKHLFESLENHGGDIWFHFNAFKEIYGFGFAIPFIYLIGLVLLLKNSKKIVYRIAIISAIAFTYAFYTFASTKMMAYCIIVSPFFFIGLGSLSEFIISLIRNKVRNNKLEILFEIIMPLVICIFLFNITKIQDHHTNWKPNSNRKVEMDEMSFIKQLQNQLGNDKYVIFNAKIRLNGHIPIMYYTNYIAYGILPTEKQINLVHSKDFKIAILDNDSLPDYIRYRNEIVKIKNHTK